MASGTGLNLVHEGNLPLHGWLFGEDQARYLLAVDEAAAKDVRKAAKAAGVPLHVIGIAGGDALTINGTIEVSIADLKAVNESFMPTLMGEAE